MGTVYSQMLELIPNKSWETSTKDKQKKNTEIHLTACEKYANKNNKTMLNQSQLQLYIMTGIYFQAAEDLYTNTVFTITILEGNAKVINRR